MMVDFINRYRETLGVESICRILYFAPSAYYDRKRQLADPELPSTRRKPDESLKIGIELVWEENFRVYGVRKVWSQLRREGIFMARCTIERLMRAMGPHGVVRRACKRTTIPADKDPRPLDLVRRRLQAMRLNRLWVAEFAYVATWAGFVYTAFVIDVFSRMIVGWRVYSAMYAELTLDALEKALWARKVKNSLIHHSDRGSQYLSIRYDKRLAEAGIEASVGSVGDAYDNAMAETVNGVYKADEIWKRGFWKIREYGERVTLEWVRWFNTKRMLESIGNVPPAEFEKAYYATDAALPAATGYT